jgi:ribonuclease HII
MDRGGSGAMASNRLAGGDGMISSGSLVGVDEVGRGCLFGPVVAAAVILPDSALPGLIAAGLTDSKALSEAQRQTLDQRIRTQALSWGLGLSSVAEIDRWNILQASLLAMKRALQKLDRQPQLCLVDGNRAIPGLCWPQRTLVGGDGLEPSIGAASIVAKVWRDRLLLRLAHRYPGYGLAQNKGYGTRQHRDGIRRWGITPLHRRSFAPCREAALTTPLEGLGSGGEAAHLAPQCSEDRPASAVPTASPSGLVAESAGRDLNGHNPD